MHLSRREIEFIGGYVWGRLAATHGFEINVREIEELVGQAVAALDQFPSRRSAVQAEMEAELATLLGDV